MTIPLRLTGDGSLADFNFQQLKSLVLDTGGKSLSVRFGVDEMTWTASTDSGPYTIAHGLGKTPIVVFVTNGNTTGGFPGFASFTTATLGPVTFDAYGRTAAVVTASKAIFWIAIG